MTSMIQQALDAQAPAKRDGFYTALQKLTDEGYEVEEAVEKILKRKEFRENIITAVSTSFRNYLRTQTRSSEKIAAVEVSSGNYVNAKQAVLGKSFFDPGSGETVEWVKATAEQHRARAKWLRQRAASTIDTAETHELFARVIVEAQVKNFSQIRAIHKFPELEKAAKAIK